MPIFFVQVRDKEHPIRIAAPNPPDSTSTRVLFRNEQGQQIARFSAEYLIGWWTEEANEPNLPRMV